MEIMTRVILTTIGHLSHDLISLSTGTYEALGGSSAYVSLILAKFNVKVGLVTKVGKDFKKEYFNLLEKSEIDLKGFKMINGKTTSFKNVYTDGDRRQFLISLCKKIRLNDVPEGYFESKILHFGPIFKEISYNLIKEANKRGVNVALDVQGFCRG
ncbi:hypothetical protein DRN86_04005, partial [Candidatus Geothermarchaeota archaeon]